MSVTYLEELKDTRTFQVAQIIEGVMKRSSTHSSNKE